MGHDMAGLAMQARQAGVNVVGKKETIHSYSFNSMPDYCCCEPKPYHTGTYKTNNRRQIHPQHHGVPTLHMQRQKVRGPQGATSNDTQRTRARKQPPTKLDQVRVRGPAKAATVLRVGFSKKKQLQKQQQGDRVRHSYALESPLHTPTTAVVLFYFTRL